MYSFAALQAGYTHCLVNMKITRSGQVDATARKLLVYVDQGRYDDACRASGVPIIVAATSFEREASSNFHLSPAQGDPLWERSVHVPRGLGPYISANNGNLEAWKKAWAHAAADAYHIDRLDAVGAANWSWEMACYKEEMFNGFGPRMHGRVSGYLFAGSSTYTGGKYIADGVWSSAAVDSQLGVIPVMFRMVELRPSLTLPIAFPSLTPSLTPPTIEAAPDAVEDVKSLQAALNTLGANPQLGVDGNYGRMTRRAVETFQQANGLDDDGIAGKATWAAIHNKLPKAA